MELHLAKFDGKITNFSEIVNEIRIKNIYKIISERWISFKDYLTHRQETFIFYKSFSKQSLSKNKRHSCYGNFLTHV